MAQIARDFVRADPKFKVCEKRGFADPAMANPLVVTCRSGCALCEGITSRLTNQAGSYTPFDLLLSSPGGVISAYVMTGWPTQENVWPAHAEVVKAERPPPTPRTPPGCLSQASEAEFTQGMSALHPSMPPARESCKGSAH